MINNRELLSNGECRIPCGILWAIAIVCVRVHIITQHQRKVIIGKLMIK